jgi:hypothetical protein
VNDMWNAVKWQTAIVIFAVIASAHGARAESTINSVADLSRALKACLTSSTVGLRPGVALSARMGFRRNGELLGKPFISFQTPNMTEEEKENYRVAVADALARCTPLPFSTLFGNAMAGHPLTLHISKASGPTTTL